MSTQFKTASRRGCLINIAIYLNTLLPMRLFSNGTTVPFVSTILRLMSFENNSASTSNDAYLPHTADMVPSPRMPFIASPALKFMKAPCCVATAASNRSEPSVSMPLLIAVPPAVPSVKTSHSKGLLMICSSLNCGLNYSIKNYP